MPKPVKKQNRPADVNELAHHLVKLSTEAEDPPAHDAVAFSNQLSVYMAEIGKKGGRIGGKKRLKTMTAKECQDAARKAAKARWSKRKSARKQAIPNRFSVISAVELMVASPPAWTIRRCWRRGFRQRPGPNLSLYAWADFRSRNHVLACLRDYAQSLTGCVRKESMATCG